MPESNDRLSVPVIETADKTIVAQLNKTQLELFMDEKCQYAPGYLIKFSDFYERFKEWCDADEVSNWSKIRVGREIPPKTPRARRRKDGQFAIGNLTWAGSDTSKTGKKFVVKGLHLLEVEG